MYKDAEVLMRHILDECDFIVSITQNLSKEEFVKDGQLSWLTNKYIVSKNQLQKLPFATNTTSIEILKINSASYSDFAVQQKKQE